MITELIHFTINMDAVLQDADVNYMKQKKVVEMETVLADKARKSAIGDISQSPFFCLKVDKTCGISI